MSVALESEFVKRFLFRFWRNLCFLAKKGELVVHSGKWATSSCEIGIFPWFPAKSMEPVVHSRKWTTSSCEIGPFSRFSGQIRGASGPLWKVDHWLARIRAFYLVFRPNQRSQWSTLESGPLAHAKSGLFLRFRKNLRSQWSTPESGPLAQEHRAIFPTLVS